MTVTLSGIVMPVRLSNPEKALPAITFVFSWTLQDVILLFFPIIKTR